MVMEFGHVVHLVQQAVIEILEQQDLNRVTGCYTTAENLVVWVWDRLEAAELQSMQRIRLWETETGWVTLEKPA